MSHHSDQPFDGEELRKIKQQFMDTSSFRGAVGAFPEGKLTPSDEGAIQFAIGEKDGKVIMDFGTPVVWVGMNPQQAADLASDLMKWARLVGRKQGETITMTIGG